MIMAKKLPPAPSPKNAVKDRQFVSALARGLEILRCFTPGRQQLGTADIAKLLGLPQPTVWRLCHTLLDCGFLTWAAEAKKLRLGLPVLSLGYAALASQPIAELARPSMQAIADRFHGAVSLAAPDDLNMIYLQRCQWSSVILADLHVGSRMPMAYTATGWAYLAGLREEERSAVLSRIRTVEGARWKEAEPRFTAALKRYRADGYIVDKGMLHQHINAVAVPLRLPDATLLALNCAGIVSIFHDGKLREVGSTLKEFAARLAAGAGSDAGRR
jgi:DNA-binding IclR family transcriptional regulator